MLKERRRIMKALNSLIITTLMLSSTVQADNVILDDLIVDGSACIGFDCVDGESFGFETLRLKENNLNIHFQDTSSSASFPANDWRIMINDSSNGGGNYMAIQDATAGVQIFRVDAGAPANSLRVDSQGDLGIGTANPVVNIHTADGDTPTLRLEQDGSSGFTPQSWDMAGNETNFFIRDVTNGSTLPFRIRPGAPTSALDIAGSGNVGIGTGSPSQALHVRRTDGTAQMLVEEVNSGVSARTLLELKNNGNTKLSINNTDANVAWAFANDGNGLRISRQSSGAVEFDLSNNGNLTLQSDSSNANTKLTLDNSNTGVAWAIGNNGDSLRLSRQSSGVVEFDLSNAGNLTIQGNLTELSSRTQKHNIVAMNISQILGKVLTLPISEWSYKDSKEGVRHIGPMAEDFYQTFGLGKSPEGIATIDTSGVALAAIQGLKAEKDNELATLKAEKDAQILALKTEQATLKSELLELRQMIHNLKIKTL